MLTRAPCRVNTWWYVVCSVGYYLPGESLGQSTKVLWTQTDFIRKFVLTFPSWPSHSEVNLSMWIPSSWGKNQGKVNNQRFQIKNGQLTEMMRFKNRGKFHPQPMTPHSKDEPKWVLSTHGIRLQGQPQLPGPSQTLFNIRANRGQARTVPPAFSQVGPLAPAVSWQSLGELERRSPVLACSSEQPTSHLEVSKFLISCLYLLSFDQTEHSPV